MPEPTYQRLAVIGVGLIGGSVALAARARGLAGRVVGYARSDASEKRLRELGVVDEVAREIPAAVDGADFVVVATPVGAAASAAQSALRHAPKHALVTDAASTKARLVERVVRDAGEAASRFVGAHPLAGDHRAGAEFARADLFDGAATVITPVAGASDDAQHRVAAFWEALGSRVYALSPAEHDARLARTSHLPHVAASAVAAITPEADLSLAATGWADTTRVAAGSPSLWRDILLANSEATAEAVDRLREELAQMAVALHAADGDQIEKILQRGKRRRDALGG
ncbi:MAG: prephenate dehydrogenase/arogenate dehydrogenase family protein [Planctomycetota bacterium]